MRELKFRIWDRKKKEFRKDYSVLLDRDGSLNDTKKDDYVDGEYDVLQYTGLKDKNGKEIYEGDIVKVIKRIDDEQGGYYLDDEESIIKVRSFDYECGGITWFPKDAEIIGNIHENPELLNGR